MAGSAEFKQVSDDVRHLDTPSREDFELLYSLYKQALEGDCKRARPGDDDLIGQAKYDAWMKRTGMSQEEAAQKYIAEGKRAKAQYGLKG